MGEEVCRQFGIEENTKDDRSVLRHKQPHPMAEILGAFDANQLHESSMGRGSEGADGLATLHSSRVGVQVLGREGTGR